MDYCNYNSAVMCAVMYFVDTLLFKFIRINNLGCMCNNLGYNSNSVIYKTRTIRLTI